jgi:hypothetical protein
LAVVEAMKMLNVLKAGLDATVSTLKAKPGDSFAVDAVMDYLFCRQLFEMLLPLILKLPPYHTVCSSGALPGRWVLRPLSIFLSMGAVTARLSGRAAGWISRIPLSAVVVRHHRTDWRRFAGLRAEWAPFLR